MICEFHNYYLLNLKDRLSNFSLSTIFDTLPLLKKLSFHLAEWPSRQKMSSGYNVKMNLLFKTQLKVFLNN